MQSVQTFRRFMWQEAKTQAFRSSLAVSLVVGVCSCSFHVFDNPMYLGYNFLTSLLPDLLVFNCFMIFIGLVGSVRTSHALSRFTDAATYTHKLQASWYNTASTLFAFCNNARGVRTKTEVFQNTLVRLMSVLSAQCFENLTTLGTGASGGLKFDVIDLESLSTDMKEAIMHCEFAPELVLQSLQQLIVDASRSKDGDAPVLDVPAPILTRSWQDLGAGFGTYHEAMQLAKIPLPFAFELITGLVLICQAVMTPFVIANVTQGAVSSFTFAFAVTMLVWYLNSVADSLTNPFARQAHTLHLTQVQRELNMTLIQMLSRAREPVATVTPENIMLFGEDSVFTISSPIVLQAQSLGAFKAANAIESVPEGAGSVDINWPRARGMIILQCSEDAENKVFNKYALQQRKKWQGPSSGSCSLDGPWTGVSSSNSGVLGVGNVGIGDSRPGIGSVGSGGSGPGIDGLPAAAPAPAHIRAGVPASTDATTERAQT